MRAYGNKRSGILSGLVGFGCGLLWFRFSCVESYDLLNPFVDHTLRILIQRNWVVVTYNFNIVILYSTLLFPLLYNTTAQKEKMD
jgi:hypothetical protein